jgi:protein-tyrosine phosphatase
MLTDLHCHMLPGIDDGAHHLGESLAMARIAVQDGISTAVLTPHHLKGDYTNPADVVRRRCRELGVELERAGIALDVLPGSELHLVPELPEAIHRGQALTIADREKAVLVELPTFTIPVGSEILLEQILAQGLSPLIAHPERNHELRRAPELGVVLNGVKESLINT